jgi:hypothetical protein
MMNLTATQRLGRMTNQLFKNFRIQSGSVYTLVIVLALAAFEIFNFSVTHFALRDMLGNYGSGLLSWPLILALAFCAMDVAGIASILSTPDKTDRSGWYLLGAWVLAAAMNAGLTWWGISVAIYNQPAHDVLLVDPMTYVTLVPVLVAVMVWVIRVLIIGSLVGSIGALDGQEKPTRRQKAFGFRTEKGNAPAGFTPMPSRAQMEESGFPH